MQIHTTSYKDLSKMTLVQPLEMKQQTVINIGIAMHVDYEWVLCWVSIGLGQ